MKKHLFKINLGNTVESNSSAIAFLWSNWDVFYTINPKKIKTKRVSENEWESSGFLFKGKYTLISKVITVDEGAFNFYSTLKFLWFEKFDVKINTFYKRIDINRLSYWSNTEILLPKYIQPLHSLFRLLVREGLFYMNSIGGETTEKITKSKYIINEICGEKAYNLYQEYHREELLILSGDYSNIKYFEKSFGENYEREYIETFLKRVDTINQVKNINQFVNIDDYYFSCKHHTENIKASLIINRSLIEVILKKIFKKEKIDYGYRDGCGKLIEIGFNKLKSIFSDNILRKMEDVKFFGDRATHTEEDDSMSYFKREFYCISFKSTLDVTEWFIFDYLKL